MNNQFASKNTCYPVFILIALAILANGCALGVTKVKVEHDALVTVENKREGKLLVKQFIDNRKDTVHIGNKRNMYGMVLGHIGTLDGVRIDALLTEYFAEALTQAGYNVTIYGSQSDDRPRKVEFDAIVEGEITKFWLDLYMATWHNVIVRVKLLDKNTQKVKWEKEILGNEKNVLWVGATAEYEKVIRQALTKALNQAVKEFSSDEFYINLRHSSSKGKGYKKYTKKHDVDLKTGEKGKSIEKVEKNTIAKIEDSTEREKHGVRFIVVSKGVEKRIRKSSNILRDKKTGLEWIAGPDEVISLSKAKDWIIGLNADGNGWRMPTVDELRSLSQGDVENIINLLEITGWQVFCKFGKNIELYNLKNQKMLPASRWEKHGGIPATIDRRVFAVRSSK